MTNSLKCKICGLEGKEKDRLHKIINDSITDEELEKAIRKADND